MSRRRHEGYLKIDHSASPGLEIPGLGDGTVFEASLSADTGGTPGLMGSSIVYEPM